MIDKEQVMAQLAGMADFFTQTTEVQLADWGETSSGGPYAKFRYLDPELLEPFRGKTKATRGKTGTRYMMLLIEITDDDEPVNQKQKEKMEEGIVKLKGGRLSIDAAMLTKDKSFIRYLNDIQPAQQWTEASANTYLLMTCGISSKTELDHNETAARKYEMFIKKPFNQWWAEDQQII